MAVNHHPDIRFVANHKLDPEKWDSCINRSDNGLVYAQSAYLDHMAPGWNALVWKDYEAVMPLPSRKKYGIRYIYHPYLCARLGLFAVNPEAALLKQFLIAIPASFRYIDMPLNHGNLFSIPGFPMKNRLNYTLSLATGYEALRASYRTNIKRNISRAENAGCRLERDININLVTQLAEQYGMGINAEGNKRFEQAFEYFKKRDKAVALAIVSKHGEPLATAAFLFDEKRAHYLLVGNHPDGRTRGASHALIDGFIREYAGTGLLLDFEGSDIRNLAFFYESFGAQQELYPTITLNRLPRLIRWLRP